MRRPALQQIDRLLHFRWTRRLLERSQPTRSSKVRKSMNSPGACVMIVSGGAR